MLKKVIQESMYKPVKIKNNNLCWFFMLKKYWGFTINVEIWHLKFIDETFTIR
ncbi:MULTISPECIES: hypothetical protein [unclassified Clostridium]|uniref:hypothetical protein n=1 Tax=unclassified Clostridium TaxID=2614128 RepID=UPI003217E7EE